MASNGENVGIMIDHGARVSTGAVSLPGCFSSENQGRDGAADAARFSSGAVSLPGCLTPANQGRDGAADEEPGATDQLRSVAAAVGHESSGTDGLAPDGNSSQPVAPIATFGVDMDSDGRADVYLTGVDRDHDGIPDVLQQECEAATFDGLLKQLNLFHTREIDKLKANNAGLKAEILQLSAQLGHGTNGSKRVWQKRVGVASQTSDSDDEEEIVRLLEPRSESRKSSELQKSSRANSSSPSSSTLSKELLQPMTPTLSQQSVAKLPSLKEGTESQERDSPRDVDESPNGLSMEADTKTASFEALFEERREARATFQERFVNAGEPLKIMIEEARNLRAADWLMGRKSDPYCVVEIHGKPWATVQTDVVQNTLNPEWNQEFELKDFRPGDSLKFTVKDRDWTTSDDVLGKASLVNMQFYPGGFDSELKLTEAHAGGRRIHRGAFLKVHVEPATFRPVMGSNATLWPAWQRVPEGFKDLNLRRERMAGFTCAALAESAATGKSLTQNFLNRSHSGLLKPDSTCRMGWDMMGIFILILDLIWIPMLVFEPQETIGVLFIEWLTLLYWTVDMLMSLSTGFYTTEQMLVMKRSAIVCRYARGWFLFDITLVGIDWSMNIKSWAGGDEDNAVGQGSGMARAGRLARITRIIRLLRLMRLARLRQVLFQLQCLVDSESLMVMLTILNNLFIILAINHYCACLWFAVGAASPTEQSWITRYKYRGRGYGIQYVTSLHWSLTQFTPGPGQIQPESIIERVTAVCVLGCGLVVFTCFMSSITSTMSAVWTLNRYNNTQEFLLKKFLRQKQISRSLGSRITRYIDFVVRMRQKSIPLNKVHHLQMLSGPLNIELQTELVEPHLCYHSFFMAYSTSKPAFRELCTTAVESHSFAKTDVLFRANLEAKFMYFITTGSLVYRYKRSYMKKQLSTVKLHEEQWCSEAVLWMPWIHKGVLRVVSDAQILTLSSSKFREVTVAAPDTFMLAHRYAMNYIVHVHIVDESELEGLTDVAPEFLMSFAESDEVIAQDILKEVREAEEIEARMVALKEEGHKDDTVDLAKKLISSASVTSGMMR